MIVAAMASVPESREPPAPAAVAWPESPAAVATPNRPPPPRLTSSPWTPDKGEGFGLALTETLEALADIERRRRRLTGALTLGSGAALVAVGLSTRLLTSDVDVETASIVVMAGGGSSIASGVSSLLVRGPTERLVQSELFAQGAREGWTPERVEAIRRVTRIEAAKARRRRLISGSVFTVVGVAGAAVGGTLFGLELTREDPNGFQTAVYGQMLAGGTGLILRGVVSLASPTVIEAIAKGLRLRPAALQLRAR